jgi:hypothetical protein
VPDKETLAAGLARIRKERKTALRAWLVAAVMLATVVLLTLQLQTFAWVSMIILGAAFLWAIVTGLISATAECPNCKKSFHFHGDDYFTTSFSDTAAKKCLHCGLRLEGSNVETYGL